jgi:hypothetical protein
MDKQTLETIQQLELKIEVHETILISLIARLNNISLEAASKLVKNMNVRFSNARPVCDE